MPNYDCPTPIGYFIDKTDKSFVSKRGCDSWDCKPCSLKKVRRMRAKILHYFQEQNIRCRMLTLTLSPQFPDYDIMKAWNRLRASLRKYINPYTQEPYTFNYCLVKEFHTGKRKKGEGKGLNYGRRHLHIIIDQYIPENILKHLWYLATDNTSTGVDIRYVPYRKVGRYLTKYLTKQYDSGDGFEEREFKFKRREHRYAFSRCFPKLDREINSPYYRKKRVRDMFIKLYQNPIYVINYVKENYRPYINISDSFYQDNNVMLALIDVILRDIYKEYMDKNRLGFVYKLDLDYVKKQVTQKQLSKRTGAQIVREIFGKQHKLFIDGSYVYLRNYPSGGIKRTMNVRHLDYGFYINSPYCNDSMRMYMDTEKYKMMQGYD